MKVKIEVLAVHQTEALLVLKIVQGNDQMSISSRGWQNGVSANPV